MKRLMYLLLAVSVAGMAEEPKQNTAPPLPITGQLEAPALPKLEVQRGQGLQLIKPAAAGVRFIGRPVGGCFFIKTVRPVPAYADASRSGFLMLQSRTSGFVREPVCTGDAILMRAIPVAGKIAAVAGGDSTRQSR